MVSGQTKTFAWVGEKTVFCSTSKNGLAFFKCEMQIIRKDMVRKAESTTVYWLDNTLYLNITNKCSNNCGFCIRNFKTGVGGFNLRLEKEPSANKVISELERVIHSKRWNELVFCGFGEPTQRLDLLLEITQWVRQHYGRQLTIRVDTNGHGYLLNPRRNVAKELKAAGVNKVSVSLNAANEGSYNEICKPNFQNAYTAVLDFIRKSRDILDLEVTAVTIPEVDLREVEAVAKKLGVNFRLRQYLPCFW
jgi:cyclic pyranopterin phosphate synthase